MSFARSGLLTGESIMRGISIGEVWWRRSVEHLLDSRRRIYWRRFAQKILFGAVDHSQGNLKRKIRNDKLGLMAQAAFL